MSTLNAPLNSLLDLNVSTTISLPTITHLHLRELFKVRGMIGLSTLFADLVLHTLPTRAGIDKLGGFENAFNQGFAMAPDVIERLDCMAASPTLMPLLVNRRGPYTALKPNRSRTMAALIASAYMAECNHVAIEREEARLSGLSAAERAAAAQRIEAQAAARQAQAAEQSADADIQLNADMAAALAEALK